MLNFLSPYKFYLEAAFVAMLLAALAFIGYRFVQYEQQVGYNRAVVEWQQKQIASDAAALKRENELQAQLSNAENERVKREQIIKVTSAKLDAATRSLRDTIDKYNSVKLPDDTETAAISRAATLGQLLGECSTKYSELAKQADEHVNDIKTLIQSYPNQ